MSGPGGDQQDPNNPDYPCPGQPTTEFHTNGIDDLGGCALGVAYKSDISQIQPVDITIFSVNQTCVWYLHTDFQIPAQMPKCPEGGCICAWFWIHRADSGSEQSGFLLWFLLACRLTGYNSVHDGFQVRHDRCRVDRTITSSSGPPSVCATSQ